MGFTYSFIFIYLGFVYSLGCTHSFRNTVNTMKLDANFVHVHFPLQNGCKFYDPQRSP